uniref:T-complex protein 1 subunit alpha n=1 Tax=Arcella intermedia TaxID=1963864 RepID=A0A6B2L1D9_9EUKA
MSVSIEQVIDGARQKGEDVRSSNVTACVALANIVKTSFGPTGLDKMLVDEIGDVTITNDGATILSKLEVEHPAAKVLVELAHLQDKEVGDGTTSVVLLAAELLKRGNALVKKKIHPTSIISGYRVAMREACSYVKERCSIPINELGNESLVQCAKTSIASKIIGSESDYFSNMVVNALKRVARKNDKGKVKYPIGAINILKATGKSSRDSLLVEGFALNCVRASEGMPKQLNKVKIALLDFNLERTKLPNGVVFDITDPEQTHQLHKREDDILKERVELIIKSGANVILTTKGIDDLATKYMVESGVIGVRRVSKSDLKYIARATGGTVLLTLANLEGGESFDPSTLGEAESISQEPLADQELIIIKGTKNNATASIILRGANSLMLEEMERSVHDSLCAVKRVLESREVVPGGGAVETALSMHLETFAESLGTREMLAVVEFANALLAIPKILVVNAAYDATDLIAKLCTLHHAGQTNPEKKHYSRFGLDLHNGKVRNSVEAGVLEPTMSKIKSIRFATEAAITILRIDDHIQLNPKPEPQHPGHDH